MEEYGLTKKLSLSVSKRNMLLYGAGKLVSLFGAQIYSFAISLYVLKLTNSGMTFATSLVFSMLPRVLMGPIAGVAADRIDRKKIVLSMDILCGILMLSFYGIAVLDEIRLAYIYGFSFLLTTLNTFFDVAIDASKPNLVDREDIFRINSIGQGIMSVAAISGPFLGGLIYAIVDIKVFLLINGISFILSAISEAFIDFGYNANSNESESNGKNEGFIKELKEGFSYFINDKIIFNIMSFSLLINFLMQLSITVPIPYFLNNVVMLSPLKYGIVKAFMPVGMLLGAISLSMLPQKEKLYKRLMLLMTIFIIFVFTMGIPMMSISMSADVIFIFYLIAMGGLGFTIAWIDIPLLSVMQRETPDEIRGRVFGLIGTAAIAIAPLGVILAGILLELVPMWLLPMVSGLLLSIRMLFFMKNEAIKNI